MLTKQDALLNMQADKKIAADVPLSKPVEDPELLLKSARCINWMDSFGVQERVLLGDYDRGKGRLTVDLYDAVNDEYRVLPPPSFDWHSTFSLLLSALEQNHSVHSLVIRPDIVDAAFVNHPEFSEQFATRLKKTGIHRVIILDVVNVELQNLLNGMMNVPIFVSAISVTLENELHTTQLATLLQKNQQIQSLHLKFLDREYFRVMCIDPDHGSIRASDLFKLLLGVASALEHSAVTELDLSNCELGRLNGDSLRYFITRIAKSNIVTLSLRGNRLINLREHPVFRTLQFTKVKSLDLSGNFLITSYRPGTKFNEILFTLGEALKNIETLDLSDHSFEWLLPKFTYKLHKYPDICLSHLAKGLKGGSLKKLKLDFSSVTLSYDQFEKFFEILCSLPLTHLDLSGSAKIFDEPKKSSAEEAHRGHLKRLQTFGILVSCSSTIKKLTLKCCNFNNDSVAVLYQVFKKHFSFCEVELLDKDSDVFSLDHHSLYKVNRITGQKLIDGFKALIERNQYELRRLMYLIANRLDTMHNRANSCTQNIQSSKKAVPDIWHHIFQFIGCDKNPLPSNDTGQYQKGLTIQYSSLNSNSKKDSNEQSSEQQHVSASPTGF